MNPAADPDTAMLPSKAECSALGERIAASSHFRRSARLRDFLLYVVNQSLRDPQGDLNEQEIGEKVFGRPVSYDRSHDNIVRVNATELRRRIDLYFAGEGAAESWILEIPRGGYKPVYHRCLTKTPTSLEAAPTYVPSVLETVPEVSTRVSSPASDPEEIASPKRFSQPVGWIVAAVLFAVLCGLLLRQSYARNSAIAADSSKAALTTFWSQFGTNHQQTDIVLPDDTVSLIEDLTHRPVTLQDYLDREYMQPPDGRRESSGGAPELAKIASHNLVTFGAVRAAQVVLEQLSPVSSIHLTQARFYTTDAMKRNNVILLGGRKANPWVRLLENRMNFVVDFDYEKSRAFVSNLHPRADEQAEYVAPLSDNALTAYSVVAYLPNPGNTGDAIVLAGVDSDSTSAAAEFLTSEKKLETLQHLMKVKQFPYFEVLLKNSRLSGTSFGSEILAYRVYSKAE